MTPYQEQQLQTAKKVKEYKLSCEANIVSIFYKEPETLYATDIKLEDISENVWRVYYQIVYDIVVKEQKTVVDEVTVGLYLEKHDKLRQKYEEYGGWNTIMQATEYVKIENLEGYIKDLKKWNCVMQLIKYGFPVSEKLSEYADMTADDIYNELETLLNHSFINADDDIKAYSLADGIDDLLDDLDKGLAVGLPYYNMPLLTSKTGGQLHGNITLVGGLSNVGKTTLARNSTLPSIINHNEKVVVMLNEESPKKWQREMIVWCANNIFKESLQKFVLRDGNYTDELWVLLRKCADWIKEKSENHTITLVPFKRYKTSEVLKTIKKYCGMGVRYFILDTFKADADSRAKDSSSNAMMMSQAMVEINDLIKEENKDVHILITFQLNKASAKQRFYTQDNIGVAKSITDVASTTIMIRNLFDDEKPNGKNPIQVYKLEGTKHKVKVPVTLDEDKHYQVIFVVKNREGAANNYQIIAEHDLSRNTLKEVGITKITQDF